MLSTPLREARGSRTGAKRTDGGGDVQKIISDPHRQLRCRLPLQGIANLGPPPSVRFAPVRLPLLRLSISHIFTELRVWQVRVLPVLFEQGL